MLLFSEYGKGRIGDNAVLTHDHVGECSGNGIDKTKIDEIVQSEQLNVVTGERKRKSVSKSEIKKCLKKGASDGGPTQL